MRQLHRLPRPSGPAFPISISMLIIICLLLTSVASETRDKSKEEAVQGSQANDEANGKEPYQPITLQASIKKSMHQDAQAAREKYWKKTLEEIRSLAVSKPSKKRSKKEADKALNRWKIFSTSKAVKDNTERYNGYFSWDRLLQEWSDDIQEYLDKVESEGKGYSMSNFGVPPAAQDLTEKKEPLLKETAVKEEKDLEVEVPEKEIEVSEVVLEEPTTSVATNPIPVIDADPEAATATSASIQEDDNHLYNNDKPLRPIPAPRKEGEAVLPHTDISDKSKRIWIVTTASLPWMTGTAVNPLLRAAYMTVGRKQAGGSVTLMLPWLERKEDQDAVYGVGKAFATPEDQEAHVRGWLKNTANMKEASEELNIRWYTAWQNKAENSVYSMGDIVATISEDEVDIMVLEEPEHLNWYRAPGENWTQKFKHVVGILHTNYFVYAQDQPGALVRAPAMKLLCTWMCRSHCHRLVKLSGTLGQYAPEKELIENVHGVRGTFIDIGKELRQKLIDPTTAASDPVFSPTAEPKVYFIGKMLWSKGIGSLMELLKYAEETANIQLHVDMFGGGPDKDAADAKAKKMEVDMSFLGPIDHAELAMSHKVFINPSTSEVLCTTVAEALAMGKFVVLPSHPSNDFFAQFPNCLPYTSKEEFVGNLYYALTHSPEPMSEEYSYALSWKAATERFEKAGCIPLKEAQLYEKWVDSGNAGVEITLPPLIENEESRKLVASTIEKSRASFRKFRENLSKEISVTKVLPKTVRDSLVKDLDKRLDLDIDDLLTSPKLELNLCPAELDKQCLEFYESVVEGPSGDILRVIGGGNDVAMQHRYMKRKARNQLREARAKNSTAPFFLDDSFDNTGDNTKTASQLVRWTMRRNLPTNGTFAYGSEVPPNQEDDTTNRHSSSQSATDKRETNLRMSILQSGPTLCKRRSSLSPRPWGGVPVLTPSRWATNARTMAAKRNARGLSLLI